MNRDPYRNVGLNLPTDESSSEDEAALEMYISDGTPDGIPEYCFCGGRMFIQREASGENKGRAYYACDQRIRSPHFRKWWDLTVTEEVRSLVKQSREQNYRIQYLENENANKRTEIEELKGRLLNLEMAVFGKIR